MFRAHEGGVLSLAAGPSAGQLLSGGADRRLALWDLRMASSSSSPAPAPPPPARLAVWRGHKDAVQSILLHGASVISFGGARMGVCSAAAPADAAEIAPVRIRSARGKERAAITASALLPCARALVCGTDDGLVRIVS